MALRSKGAWGRQAVLTRIRHALDAFTTLQRVDWDYDVKQILNEILALALKELDFDGEKQIERGLLLVRPPGGGPLEVEAGYHTGKELEFSHTIVTETFNRKEPVLCANACQDPRFRNAESIRNLEVLSCISVPLRTEKEVFGAVYVESRSPRSIFVDDDVKFLNDFARAVTPYAKTALTHDRHLKEIRKLHQQVSKRFGFQEIIGKSRAMSRMFDLARVAADGDQTVLLSGESGTGKELLARAIHYNSPRKNNSFVVVDCSAMAEPLLESELFGHCKGAFTGASAAKTGAFEEANGGTVFLDEISDASKPMQQKLRRVLEEGEVRPVGSTSYREVNVRVLAATNRDLRKEMEEERFLRDLYFRLNRFPIRVPAVRERPEDIPLLAMHFVQNTSDSRPNRVSSISPEAMDFLISQRWEENNVRELRNYIELACDLAPGRVIDRGTLIRVKSLLNNKAEKAASPGELVTINTGRFQTIFRAKQLKPYRVIERQFTGKVIAATLRVCEWKLRKAARMLGLSPGKVRESLREYLEAERQSAESLDELAEKLEMPEQILEKKLSDLGIG